MTWLKDKWLSLSLKDRKRIVSFLNTFAVSFTLLFLAKLELEFPGSWTALGALCLSATRSALREALDLLLAEKE